MWELFYAGAFGCCIEVPSDGWLNEQQHVEQDRHKKKAGVEASASGKRSSRSSLSGASRDGRLAGGQLQESAFAAQMDADEGQDAVRELAALREDPSPLPPEEPQRAGCGLGTPTTRLGQLLSSAFSAPRTR
jgi:hypothetical protein